MAAALNCMSQWQLQSECELNSCVKVVSELPEDVVNLLDDNTCFILKPIENQTTECDLSLNIFCNCNRHTIGTNTSEENGKHAENESDDTDIKVTSLKTAAKKTCKICSLYIDTIAIVSDARIIEIFINSFGEYYGTFNGKSVFDDGYSKMYSAVIKLEEPQKLINLKFKGLFDPHSLWIYGIFVHTNQNEAINSGIMGSQLNKRPISHQREIYKSTLCKMIEMTITKEADKEQLEKLFSINENINLPPLMENSHKSISSTPDSVAGECTIADKLISSPIVKSDLEYIKELVNQRMDNLEEKVMTSQVILEEKLNKIELMLKECLEKKTDIM